jgi:ribosomal protein S18 acetylase RimI-like enzyme
VGLSYRDDSELEVAEVAALRARCGFPAHPPEVVAQQLRGARWVVSAWEGEVLVGLARAVSDGVTSAVIHSVMVDARWRRQGVGRELLRRLMAGRGPRVLWMLHARDAGAQAFYRSLGFTEATGMLCKAPG